MSKETLTVEIIAGKGLKSGDLNGLSDPYCEVRVLTLAGPREETKRTKVINNTLDPVWNESFTFTPSDPNEDIIQIKVYDHDDATADDYLGSIEIPVCAAFGRGKVDEWRMVRSPTDRLEKGEGQLHVVYSWSGKQGKVAEEEVKHKGEKATEKVKQKEKEKGKDKKEKEKKPKKEKDKKRDTEEKDKKDKGKDKDKDEKKDKGKDEKKDKDKGKDKDKDEKKDKDKKDKKDKK
eukprot:m51a1_g1987 hypothetical protein (234) ;mRNA; f:1168921-1169866